jgi:hypothetical protein
VPVSFTGSGLEVRPALFSLRIRRGFKEEIMSRSLQIRELSYWQAHWQFLSFLSAVSLATFLAGLGFFFYRLKTSRSRPIFVKTIEGNTVAVSPENPATIGGAGSNLILEEAMPGILASLAWGNSRGVLLITPGQDVRIRINGVDALQGASYKLGQSLELITPEGDRHSMTLYSAREHEVLDEGGGFINTMYDDDLFGTEGISSLPTGHTHII